MMVCCQKGLSHRGGPKEALKRAACFRLVEVKHQAGATEVVGWGGGWGLGEVSRTHRLRGELTGQEGFKIYCVSLAM